MLVAEPSTLEFEKATEELKRHKLPGTDLIATEPIKAYGRTICSEIHNLISCVWNLEELREEGKESIVVLIYNTVDKTNCRHCSGLSFLSATYKLLSDILLSRLAPYAEEIITDHQCEFRRNSSTNDHIF
jgi:hypothetical protein